MHQRHEHHRIHRYQDAQEYATGFSITSEFILMEWINSNGSVKRCFNWSNSICFVSLQTSTFQTNINHLSKAAIREYWTITLLFVSSIHITCLVRQTLFLKQMSPANICINVFDGPTAKSFHHYPHHVTLCICVHHLHGCVSFRLMIQEVQGKGPGRSIISISYIKQSRDLPIVIPVGKNTYSAGLT